MALAATPENFRAEISRHQLVRCEIARLIGMHPNSFTNYVNGTRQLTGWAQQNIAWGINQITGLRLFEVMDAVGIIKPTPGRKHRPSFPLAVPKKRRRRSRTYAMPFGG